MYFGNLIQTGLWQLPWALSFLPFLIWCLYILGPKGHFWTDVCLFFLLTLDFFLPPLVMESILCQFSYLLRFLNLVPCSCTNACSSRWASYGILDLDVFHCLWICYDTLISHSVVGVSNPNKRINRLMCTLSFNHTTSVLGTHLVSTLFEQHSGWLAVWVLLAWERLLWPWEHVGLSD